MNKTKIDWCDMTWNPVTGCFHNCPYCYARNITHRFGFRIDADPGHGLGDIQRVGKECECNTLHILREKPKNSYPYGFDPTFHRYRLDEPQHYKEPQNVFVCSMADLFGDWVPDQWINEVFNACKAAPQHRYLFLTKNPKRYIDLYQKYDVTGFWLGSTVTNENAPYYYNDIINTFLSIEPLQNDFAINKGIEPVDWVIIGAETGNRKGKVIPKREWIANIVESCRELDIPVFMKNSLAPIWGEPLIQEYPWKTEGAAVINY